MPGFPTSPAPESKKKKSFLQAAFGAYLGNKESPQEKKARLKTEYELFTTEARTIRAKNHLQREKNTLKKLSEGYGQNSNVPDYLGMNSPRSNKKSKDPFDDLGKFNF